jgi:hypothetical protein
MGREREDEPVSRRDDQANLVKGSHFYAQAVFTIAAATPANSDLFAMRWSPGAGLVAVVERIRLQYLQGTAATATFASDLRCHRVTGFTASDTGGTALTPIPKDSLLFGGGSNVTDMRFAGGGLTIGTRTVDAFPIVGMGIINTITNINPQPYREEFHHDSASIYPLILENNQGLIVRNSAAFLAAGTGTAYVMVEWNEHQPQFGV